VCICVCECACLGVTKLPESQSCQTPLVIMHFHHLHLFSPAAMTRDPLSRASAQFKHICRVSPKKHLTPSAMWERLRCVNINWGVNLRSRSFHYQARGTRAFGSLRQNTECPLGAARIPLPPGFCLHLDLASAATDLFHQRRRQILERPHETSTSREMPHPANCQIQENASSWTMLDIWGT